MVYCRQSRASFKTEFFVGKYSHRTRVRPGPGSLYYVVCGGADCGAVQAASELRNRIFMSWLDFWLDGDTGAWRPGGRERDGVQAGT